MLACISPVAGNASEPVIIEFAPTAGAIVSPERGFWRFVDDDFTTVNDQSLAALYDEGLTLGYGLVRLDKYLKAPLPDEFLKQLHDRFAATRKAGIKIILRFTYNYPENSQDYENAKDAALAVVLGHIRQLTPLLRDNADVMAVMQAGFIGAWGEGHTSSNGLDSTENKAIIRDALLAAIPASVSLQWRYPADLIAWQKTGTLGRFGFHNDCFLSSPTDVGTYSEDTKIRKTEREIMAALNDKRFHSIETCDAKKDSIRNDCISIKQEGKEMHVSAMNREYYRAFHERWKKDGCMAEITDKMGYRLRLVSAKIADGTMEVTVANDGWARLAQPRTLEVHQGRQVISLGDLQQIGAGAEATFKVAFTKNDTSASICFAAPDPNASLRSDARYAVRFANLDKPEQTWSNGAFCFKTY